MPEPAMLKALQSALDQGVASGAAPAAVLLLWQEGRELACLCAGQAQADTIFDLASLTKPLATAALALELRLDERLDWDLPLGEVWGGGVPADKAEITPRQLLAHAAGFPAHRPYFDLLERQPALSRRGLLKAMLLNEPLEYAPGTKALYSDLGYMLLGLLLEDLAQRRLHRAVAGMYEKRGIDGPCYAPVAEEPPWPLEHVAPCGPLPGRPTIHGQVEDENAFAVGGVAGHAGLFGTARQAANVMSALCAPAQGDGPWLQAEAAELFAMDSATPGSTRTPGFDTPTGPDSAAGPNAPDGVVGHLGFTGVSLWWLPARDSGAVLLTNRVAPGRDNQGIAGLRRRVHGLAWAALGLASAPGESA